MDYPDETALRIVVREGYPMALTGVDLIEAIRRLTTAALTDPDITNAEIRRRLKIPTDRTLNRIRKQHGIPHLRHPPDPWARPDPRRTHRRHRPTKAIT